MVTQRKIDEARIVYKPIALHSACLFFCLIAMGLKDPMYQFSLAWFIKLYENSLDKAEQSKQFKQRVDNIIKYLTYSIYSNVSRALFEKDKLLFSLLLTIKIMESQKKIDQNELSYLLDQNTIDKEKEKEILSKEEQQKPEYLPFTSWVRLCNLAQQSRKLQQVKQNFAEQPQFWNDVFSSQEPYQKIGSHLFSLQKLCLIKAIKYDKLYKAISDFIGEEMGEEYMRPPPFSLQASFQDSQAPVIFILPGNDPLVALKSFAEFRHVHLVVISLGQGQGKKAEKAIDEAKDQGAWVILQNCHLAPSWMPNLEKICEDLDNSKLHPEFRLFLTSYTTPFFPLTILQNGIKLTNEPPKGLKANILMSYTNERISDPNFFELQTKPREFKTLLFGLCFFHAVLQERITYGPLGFIGTYTFTLGDLRISIQQLEQFLANYSEVPYMILEYLVAECNYGGRITDEKDRRVIVALIQDYFSEQIFQTRYKFGGIINIPDVGTHQSYLRFIQSMGNNLTSELLGFHPNADIVKDIKETEDLFQNFLLVYQSDVSAKQTTGKDNDNQKTNKQESYIKQLCSDILNKLPKKYDIEVLRVKYPYSYYQTMNTILVQEAQKYNILLEVIISSLKEIESILKGLTSFSEQSENVFRSLPLGIIPISWKKVCYPNTKMLGSFIFDLQKRLNYIGWWCDNGEPNSHWMSGYFYSKAFLTSLLQNHSRKNNLAIDELGFNFEFWSEASIKDKWQKHFQQFGTTKGTMTYGLFLEGAKWNQDHYTLEEQDKHQILIQAPYMLLIPSLLSNIKIYHEEKNYTYVSPVFKTLIRKGESLSSQGQSDNFIFDVNFPSVTPSSHWIKRGVALISSLND